MVIWIFAHLWWNEVGIKIRYFLVEFRKIKIIKKRQFDFSLTKTSILQQTFFGNWGLNFIRRIYFTVLNIPDEISRKRTIVHRPTFGQLIAKPSRLESKLHYLSATYTSWIIYETFIIFQKFLQANNCHKVSFCLHLYQRIWTKIHHGSAACRL